MKNLWIRLYFSLVLINCFQYISMCTSFNIVSHSIYCCRIRSVFSFLIKHIFLFDLFCLMYFIWLVVSSFSIYINITNYYKFWMIRLNDRSIPIQNTIGRKALLSIQYTHLSFVIVIISLWSHFNQFQLMVVS